MKYPAGTVLLHKYTVSSPFVIGATNADKDWPPTYCRIGVVCFDPKPIEVGCTVKYKPEYYAKKWLGVVVAVDGEYLWVRTATSIGGVEIPLDSAGVILGLRYLERVD